MSGELRWKWCVLVISPLAPSLPLLPSLPLPSSPASEPFASFARILFSLQVSILSNRPSDHILSLSPGSSCSLVYLSEQHKLGKLPRQHEAHIGDAESDHGRPAQVPCPVERRDTTRRGRKTDKKYRNGAGREGESVCVWTIRGAALRRLRKHIHTQFQFHSWMYHKHLVVYRAAAPQASLSISLKVADCWLSSHNARWRPLADARWD